MMTRRYMSMSQRDQVQAGAMPVMDGAGTDGQDIIGMATDHDDALRQAINFFRGTGAMPIGVGRTQPEFEVATGADRGRATKAEVLDAWAPIFPAA